MIELKDSIRAVEEFIVPEGPANRDPSSPTVDGDSSKLQNDLALAEPASERRKTYSFGDIDVNMD